MVERKLESRGLDEDALWYKDAVIYELHIKAFYDSNSDGIGDFKGLTQKLDYLQDIGVTAIWVLPFCPSPLKDDGYDIANYTGIHPAYGSLRDFKNFLRQAHKRGLRVLTELVLNHTSDQHPWFQRARRAKPSSRWRDFYVWSDTPERYKEARVIFKDFESSNWTWDPVAKSYFWHRFYSHQPDLNYDNPHVQNTMLQVLDFWLEMGVDGLRLDAVPYLYERAGTNCENLPETYDFLRKLRAHVDEKFKHRMLLAEANQWPEDAAAYFGEGDMCHMAYHFPLMPRMFMALRMEDRFPITDILDQTPGIPETAQWALFLRNHDELTLEMVTDEERDYMYRVYAQDPMMRLNLGIRRRLSPLLGNHRRRIELMKGLLFSLPGTPIIYYGDEIGMGDNIYLGDRDGVRTPMQWSADRNAGFSKANPQKLYLPIIIDPEYHYEAINVETLQNNSHSILWWMKRLIALRKRFKAFGRGSIEFLNPDNRKVLVFLRRYEEERILVVANLSRFVQYVEMDLSAFRGTIPVEMFGRTEFPPIGDLPYFLTLGPHSFYWFYLRSQPPEGEVLEVPSIGEQFPRLPATVKWSSVFDERGRARLEENLPGYLQKSRWFGGKARKIKGVGIQEVLPVVQAATESYIALLQVDYTEGDSEIYALPLTYDSGEHVQEILREYPQAGFMRLQLTGRGEEGLIFDAITDKRFCTALLETIANRRRRKGLRGEIVATRTKRFLSLRGYGQTPLEPNVIKVEQSNTSIVYGDRFILKLFRRIHPGVNPDLEIGRFLTDRGFSHIPQVTGSIEYVKGSEPPLTLAILEGFVQNEGDAWAYTQDSLARYFEHILAQRPDVQSASRPTSGEMMPDDLPAVLTEAADGYLESARLLGQRTAELHLFLASEPDDPAFAPEPFSKLYQRSLYQSARGLTAQSFQLLQNRLRMVPEPMREEAQKALDSRREILSRFQSITDKKMSGTRIRCHGDYHLGQVLFTGNDFVIIDFEGEPARPISERRIKRSPLLDVAGMLRSLHYAAYAALFTQEESGMIHREDAAYFEYWTNFWHAWVASVFLKSYLEKASSGDFLPHTPEDTRALLDFHLLEKAVYELGYELNNRPGWVRIPLQGIRRLLGQ